MSGWESRGRTELGMPHGVRRNDLVEYELEGDPCLYHDAAGDIAWSGVDGVGHVARYRVVSSAAAPGIGDVNGTTKGSAARFNTGKPDLSLIPATIIAAVDRHAATTPFKPARFVGYRNAPWMDVLDLLGLFQMGADRDVLYQALWVMDRAVEGGIWAPCAEVFEYGKAKYSAWNWARGQAWSVPIASAMRHLLSILQDEENDLESGKPHAGHVACNLVMLLWFTDHYTEGDDRYKPQLLSAA